LSPSLLGCPCHARSSVQQRHQQEQRQINFQTLKTYYHLSKIGFRCDFSAQEKKHSSPVSVIATCQPPPMVHPPPSGAWLVTHNHVIFLIIIFILDSPNNNQPSILQRQNVSPGTHWIYITDNCPRPRPAPNIKDVDDADALWSKVDGDVP